MHILYPFFWLGKGARRIQPPDVPHPRGWTCWLAYRPLAFTHLKQQNLHRDKTTQNLRITKTCFCHNLYSGQELAQITKKQTIIMALWQKTIIKLNDTFSFASKASWAAFILATESFSLFLHKQQATPSQKLCQGWCRTRPKPKPRQWLIDRQPSTPKPAWSQQSALSKKGTLRI